MGQAKELKGGLVFCWAEITETLLSGNTAEVETLKRLNTVGCHASLRSIPDESQLLILLWGLYAVMTFPLPNGMVWCENAIFPLTKLSFSKMSEENSFQCPPWLYFSPSWNAANSSKGVKTLWSFGSCVCLCQPAAESGMEEDPPKDVCRRHDGRQRVPGVAKQFLAGRLEDTPCSPSGPWRLTSSCFPNSSEALRC